MISNIYKIRDFHGLVFDEASQISYVQPYLRRFLSIQNNYVFDIYSLLLFNTFFNKLILIDFPVDNDNSSTSLKI